MPTAQTIRVLTDIHRLNDDVVRAPKTNLEMRNEQARSIQREHSDVERNEDKTPVCRLTTTEIAEEEGRVKPRGVELIMPREPD